MKKLRECKKGIGVLLAMMLVLCTLPITSLAADVISVSYVDGDETKTVDAIPITADMNTISAADGQWYVVNQDVTMDTLTISSQCRRYYENEPTDVCIIVMDGKTLTVQNGINITTNADLYIYGQEEGTGTIKTSGEGNSTSGLNLGNLGCRLYVRGARLETTGASDKSGIGPGNNYSKIYIEAGTVIATGTVGSAVATCGMPYNLIHITGGLLCANQGVPITDDVNGGSHIYSPQGKSITGGIVIDGMTGTVYSDTVLPSDLSIGMGETLTVSSGKTLTIPAGKTLSLANGGTLENNGTVLVSGTLSLGDAGIVEGAETVYYALSATGGTVSGSTVTTIGNVTYARAGDTITITPSAEAATGYRNLYAINQGTATTTATFTMPAQATTVNVTTEAIPHTHAWEYSVQQVDTGTATITATCTKNDSSICTATNKSGGTITLQAPAGTLTYDGTAKSAVLSGSFSTGEETPTIVYKQGETTLDGAPAGVGTYTASVTVQGVTAGVTFTIAPVSISEVNVTMTAPTPGSTLAATASCGTAGIAGSTPTITYKVGTENVTGNAKYNTTYLATFTLIADNGYVFSDDIAATNVILKDTAGNSIVTKSAELTDSKTLVVTCELATAKAKLKSITAPADITVENGTAKTATALGLPTTVTIETEDANITTANVSWDLDNTTYDVAVLTEQTFTIKGTVTLPSNVEQNGVSLTTKVNVKATAHVHTYAATWSSDADGHWYAATCTHTGEQNAYAAHSWNAGEVTKEATTTDEGVMTYTCTVCGREKTEAIPKVEVPKSGTINVLKEKEKDNFSGGGLSNQTEDVKSLVVTEEDQTALDEGKDVNVWLEVKDNENQTPQEDVQKIAEKLWDTAYQVGVYLDVTLWKQVGDNEATKVTKVTNGKIKVSLTVPENLKKTGRTYQILRIHDGVAAILQTVYDETNACLTFETDEFSTYALIYSDETEKITDDNKTGDLVQNPNSTDSDKTEKITENTNENVPDVTALSPKADDSEIFMHLYILLLIISSGIVALTFFQKRRKGQHDVQ